jgi:hypothetical protein
MTETTKDLLARLVRYEPKGRDDRGFGPGVDMVACADGDHVEYDELHRELSASLAREAAQQAEIAHLSDHIEGVAKSTHALLCGYEKRVTDQQAEIERLKSCISDMQKRAASTRGDQAYRELPSYIVKACAAAIRKGTKP